MSRPTRARLAPALLVATSLLLSAGCGQRRSVMRPVYTPLPPSTAPATIDTVTPTGPGFEDGGILAPAGSPPVSAPTPATPTKSGEQGLTPGTRGTEELSFPREARRPFNRRSAVATRKVEPRGSKDAPGRYLSPTAARDRIGF